VGSTSLCGLYEWSEPSLVSWDDPTLDDRCHSCHEKVLHPSPFGAEDLGHKNGFERLSLCIVCGAPAAGDMAGPHAEISWRRNHGDRYSVATRLVAVHDRCAADGEAIAHRQGYGWEFDPRH
jgi:hypothetical protein